MAHFKGTVEELAELVRSCGYDVSCSDKGGLQQLRTTDGGVIDFYDRSAKRTVAFRGKGEARAKLEATVGPRLEGYVAPSHTKQTAQGTFGAGPAPKNADPKTDRVFVVHGHDPVAREQLELVLHKLGLEPFVLVNTDGGGLTIIEALEAEISGTAFGIVLMTPDDMGYARTHGAEKAEPRARQNVVMEMGMLLAAIGRSRVAILKKGHLEVPSDAHDILYIPFNDHVRETVPKLVGRLTSAGFQLDRLAITKASS
jgi:predicted nucleotide-binding protein